MFGFGMFDTNAIAELWEEKFLNAVSIHIILSRHDEEFVTEAEEEILIPSSEVIEASIVTVPGDPNATREEEDFLKEFMDRLEHKGVSQEMAECVACDGFVNIWEPTLPAFEESDQAANLGSFSQSISVPEVSMSKNTVEETPLETAAVAEETPVESAAEVVEEAGELVVEQEIEIDLPLSDLAEAIAQDTQAMLTIVDALVAMPEFAEHIMRSVGNVAPFSEPIVNEVIPQRISVRLVGSSGQSREEQVARPVQPVRRPVAVQQAVAPVALPGEQTNGTLERRKPSVLDLMPRSN